MTTFNIWRLSTRRTSSTPPRTAGDRAIASASGDAFGIARRRSSTPYMNGPGVVGPIPQLSKEEGPTSTTKPTYLGTTRVPVIETARRRSRAVVGSFDQQVRVSDTPASDGPVGQCVCVHEVGTQAQRVRCERDAVKPCRQCGKPVCDLRCDYVRVPYLEDQSAWCAEYHIGEGESDA